MLQNRVKELRARHNLNQSELGKLVGATRQTIGMIEKGDYAPSVALALKISKAFQLPLEEVFWLEEEEKNGPVFHLLVGDQEIARLD
ncbi:putative transcriptional regulator [Desulfotomaculum arcticum]|uniref:Putative transcriptional regulator n=1 Tax=Desulfotruncus arcticus DSM 17038 TaxID=1121424 RepID=A0A1I2NWQ6_9FIRM|nr:helix-turn-helix transcriptional regulator [Desulfotruncus arcticus]SFG07450.1 putative transcriptional regulator [Desulfotomaculum arcticum] [Desulfotruncus arcticus DSM 17038]